MKKLILKIALMFLLVTSISIPATAADIAGTPCSVRELNSKVMIGDYRYTCILWKNKFVWSNGTKVTLIQPQKTKSSTSPSPTNRTTASPTPTPTPTPVTKLSNDFCPDFIPCQIGSKGPGGGVIVYIADTPQSWGQYLEAAPSGWNGKPIDPISQWCSKYSQGGMDMPKALGITDPFASDVGTGRSRTQYLVSLCPSGAANLASAYRGGSKTDWFLPSKGELQLLCKNRSVVGGIWGSAYWSSSGGNGVFSFEIPFPKDGCGPPLAVSSKIGFSVRPIRSF
jgi:hypothetical protein